MELFNPKFLIIVFLTVILVSKSFAVPISLQNVGNDQGNNLDDSELEEEEEEEEDDNIGVISDDITTHGLERLSSAATCLVAGVEYTHGQQIYRKDPCEFCLCLDGEMFCWWQDCPPTLEGPCRERGPFSPCLSIKTNPLSSVAKTVPPTSTSTTTSTQKSTVISTSSTEILNLSTSSNLSSSTLSLEETSSNNNENSTDTAVLGNEENMVEASTQLSTAEPKFCTVMGRRYEIGDRLPHDTGNCIECICDTGAKLTCSPHQCAPLAEDVNDYRPPGPRHPIPEPF